MITATDRSFVKWTASSLTRIALGFLFIFHLQLAWGQVEGSSLVEIDPAQEEDYIEALRLLRSTDAESVRKAPKLLKKLAVAGHAKAQNTLGFLYRNGIGVIQSDKHAIRWFKEAAEQNDPSSMLSLAESYIEGLGVDKNYGKARTLLESLLNPDADFQVTIDDYALVRKAKSRANYLLGVIYSNGFDVERDMKKAIELFEVAAHSGDQDATMYLAITYAEGKEVEKSVEKAKEYFELLDLQSSDALRRTVDSASEASSDITEVENLREYGEVMRDAISKTILSMQTQFAKEVLNSEGEDFDAEFAAGLLKLGADGGYADAQSELAVLYYRGLGIERDLDEAATLLKAASDQGWIIAQYNLAVMIEEGYTIDDERVSKSELLESAANQGLYAAEMLLSRKENLGILNSEEAKDVCLERAKENDARALYSLARRKMVGWMVEPEPDRAKLVALFERSAEAGYSRAQYTMGMLYMSGEVVEQDIKLGFWWLKSAAAQDHPLALHHLGVCYAQGIAVETNFAEAFRYFSKSAELGLDASKNSLAVFYNNGVHVLKNEWKATELYLEAADEGDPVAALNIGNCYLEGKGVKRDVGKGVEWIARSAELGNLMACAQMAQIYGEDLLVDRDAVEVAYWREKAAELGNRQSMKLTAMNYYFGIGTPKNRGKAVYWISEYINGNGPIDTTDLVLDGEYEDYTLVQDLLPMDYSAMIVYADLLGDRQWTGYDPEEAYSVFDQLSKKGFIGARFRLAELHAHHSFSKANPKKAYSLYKSLYEENKDADLKLLRNQSGKAAYHLYHCYLDGIGVRENLSKGLKWLEIAAQGGFVGAQYDLGIRQVEGDGLEKNLDEGVRWLLAAAQQGYDKSHVALAKLNLSSPIAMLDNETIINWLKELVDSGSGEARSLLKEYGIEYKVPAHQEVIPNEGDEKERDPYAPLEAV